MDLLFCLYKLLKQKEMIPLFNLTKFGNDNTNLNSNSEIDLLQKKKKRNKNSSKKDNKVKKDSKKIIKNINEYKNDDEFLNTFNNLILFLNIFLPIFEILCKDPTDKNNITRLKIFLFYLNYFEEKRTIVDYGKLQLLVKRMCQNVINDKIFDIAELYYEDRKLEKKDWNNIKNDDIVKVKIGEFIIENVRIKYFNSKIIETKLTNIELKLIFENYYENYLSINGLKMDSIIYKNPEIEKEFKKELFNLLSSKIVKAIFQKYEPRFDHINTKYAFEGIYKNEIFNEIWDQILFIPFLDNKISGFTERTDYTIFIDSNSYFSGQDINKIISYLTSLLIYIMQFSIF